MHYEELTNICKRFNEAGVYYVLIGGFAINLHGFSRMTNDFDFLIEASEDNINRIKNSLKELLPEACQELQTKDIMENSVVRMSGETLIVDLIKNIGSYDYYWAKEHQIKETINGVLIPYANLEAMIELKGDLRDKDQKDYQFLTLKKKYLEEKQKEEKQKK